MLFSIYVLMISLCFMAPLPYILGIYNLWYLISITFGVILPIIFCIKLLYSNNIKYNSISRIIKVAIIFGLLSIYVTQ